MELVKFGTVISISLFAAMSPGPDFAVVTKSCMLHSFRAGLLASLGIATALLIHVTYCILGLGLVIYESPLIFNVIKYIGAAYLLYLGICLLKAKASTYERKPFDDKSSQNAFVSGFLCNLLNPKATLFILSLFTQIIDPGMGIPEKAFLGLTVALVTFLWFAFLSYLITRDLLQKHMIRFETIISKLMGTVLCLLSLYIVIEGQI